MHGSALALLPSGSFLRPATSDAGSHRSDAPRPPWPAWCRAVSRPARPMSATHDPRPRFIMTVAAWHKARRKWASPALVIPPVTSRSPDCCREGVRPTHGPTFFDDENRAGSSTADLKVNATTAPTAGMVISKRQVGSSCARLRTCRSSRASSWRRVARARSIGSVPPPA